MKYAIKLLLERYKADPGHMDEDGHTPLSYAAQNGHADVICEMLDTGKVGPDSAEGWGLTPLCHAALWDHKRVVLCPIEKGADVDYIIPHGDWKGNSASVIATEYGHQTIVDILNRKG